MICPRGERTDLGSKFIIDTAGSSGRFLPIGFPTDVISESSGFPKFFELFFAPEFFDLPLGVTIRLCRFGNDVRFDKNKQFPLRFLKGL